MNFNNDLSLPQPLQLSQCLLQRTAGKSPRRVTGRHAKLTSEPWRAGAMMTMFC